MMQDSGRTIVRKRMSFLSVLIISFAAVLIVLIVSGTSVAVFGLHVFDKKADTLVGLAGQAARALPDLRRALPPALADAFEDERLPEYVRELDISIRPAKNDDADRDRWRRGWAIMEVKNKGDRMVTLLSVRVVAEDEDGDVIAEAPTWAATPVQIEDEWRGPLLPHETRKLAVCRHGRDKAAKLTCEVTDVRVWRGNPAETTADTSEEP